MSEIGLELLKLVDARAQEMRESDERTWKQLTRFSSKLEKSRGRLGKNLEAMAEELRKNVERNGFSSIMVRILLPWRHHTEKRQLKLVEALLAWHNSESQELILAINALERSYHGICCNDKPLK